MIDIGELDMNGPAMEIKLYYIELLKEQYPEKHAELVKAIEAAHAETAAEETPPKQQETKE